jgi:hypothetical protein
VTDDDDLPSLATHDSEVPSGSRWRHRKTGNVYEVVCVAREESNLTPRVVYRRAAGATRPWVREYNLFVLKFSRISDDPPGFDGGTWDGETPRGAKMVDRVPNGGDSGG